MLQAAARERLVAVLEQWVVVRVQPVAVLKQMIAAQGQLAAALARLAAADFQQEAGLWLLALGAVAFCRIMRRIATFSGVVVG